MKQTQYLVIDGDTLSREGISLIINSVNPDSIIYNSESYAESVNLITNPELINYAILKLDYLDINPYVTLANLKESFASAKVVVLTAIDRPRFVRSLLEHGANSVIKSSSTHNEIVNGIRTLDQSKKRQAKPDSIGKLTQRQTQVMAYILRGQANKHIAWELGLSEGTIKLHVSSILRALKATNRTEAALRYQQLYVNSMNLTQFSIR